MNLHRSAHRRAARGLLAIAVLSSALASRSGAQTSPGTSTETTKLEAFTVTGSRIKRLDFEGPSPVLTISRDEISRTGATDLQQLIRRLPQNSLSLTNEAVFGFTPGAAGANLRGLGVEYTLTLVNGRRLSPYPAGAGGTATFSNIQGIPLSAVERVEILTDGASAIYGSDAVAGVINYILRKDFQGLELVTSYLNTFETDISTPQITLTGGITGDRGSAIFSLDWQKRNAQFRRDRAWGASSDFRTIGGLNFPTLGGSQPYGAPTFLRAVNSSGVQSGPVLATSLQPYNTQQLLANVAGTPAYNAAVTDPNTDASVSPETERYTLSGRFDYKATDNINAFAELSYSRNRTFNSIHPLALDSFGETVPGVGNLIVPASNPYNPLGVNRTDGGTPTDVRIWWRMREVGNRDSETVNNSLRLLAGAGGKLLEKWDWESAAVYMMEQAVAKNVGGYSVRSALRDALRGTTASTALNPFGSFSGGPAPMNQNAVIAGFEGIPISDSNYDTWLYDATLSGSVWDLPTGPIALSTGAELRREKLSQVRDTASAAGNFAGTGGGSNLSGERDALSLFAELNVPLLRNLEVSIAGRHEDYSDFGTAFKPKYAAAYRPLKWALVRGSYAEGFRAPALIQLFSAQSVAFQGSTVIDPHRRNPADPTQAAAYTSLRTVRGGNPALQPETSKSYYAGFVIEPDRGFLKNFSFSVDWSNIYIYDRIQTPSVTVSMNQNDPSVVIRAAPTAQDTALGQPGEVLELRLTFQNLARRTTEGLDFGANYRWSTESFGRFDFQWRGSWLYKFVTQSSSINAPIENRGTTSLPEWRWNGSVTWNYKDWRAAFTTNYVGTNDAAFQANVIAGTVPSTWLDLGPWTTYDIQVSRRLPWFKDATLTVGVDNFTNRPPPFYDNDASGYDPLVANPFGSMYYLRLSQRF